jgi:hypothetical protein
LLRQLGIGNTVSLQVAGINFWNIPKAAGKNPHFLHLPTQNHPKESSPKPKKQSKISPGSA